MTTGTARFSVDSRSAGSERSDTSQSEKVTPLPKKEVGWAIPLKKGGSAEATMVA